MTGFEMTEVVIFFGGIVLFVVVVATLTIISTKYEQKHNPDGWWA